MLKDVHHFSGDTWNWFMVKVNLRDHYGCGIWKQEEQGQIVLIQINQKMALEEIKDVLFDTYNVKW